MILDFARLSRGGAHRFLTSAVVPRPIAWVSTIGADGAHNLAPFSYFNVITAAPPLLGVSVNPRRGEPKDTLRNVRATGDFVVNLVDEPLLERMVHTSGDWPPETDEFALAGLTAAPSERVRSPRLAEAPVCMECRLEQIVELGAAALIVGRIECAHVRDDLMRDGVVDVERLRPVGRLGGDAYALLGRIVQVARPIVPHPSS